MVRERMVRIFVMLPLRRGWRPVEIRGEENRLSIKKDKSLAGGGRPHPEIFKE